MSAQEILDVIKAFFEALKRILAALGLGKEDEGADDNDNN